MSEQKVTGSHSALSGDGGTSTVNNHYHGNAQAPAAALTPARAQAILDNMPLDQVPDAGPVPPGSYLPLLANKLFVGRHSDFLKLAAVLKTGGNAVVSQSPILSGHGGVGKTQLASETAHRYGRFFAGGVFWLSFATAENVATEIARCGQLMRLHMDFTNLPVTEQVALVLERWQDGLPRLLIFDNCEDPELFKEWRPLGGACRVIVTCRKRDWPAEFPVSPLPLGCLDRGESVALLHGYRPDLDPTDPILDHIAHELGDLPLALHLAGSYLKKYRTNKMGDPKTYLAAISSPTLLNHPSLAGSGKNAATKQDLHVFRTFLVSFERLNAADPIDALALTALAHCACFAPGEPIPQWLLAATLKLDWEQDEDSCRLTDALARLTDLGLIDTDEDGAAILHRLITAFARDTASGFTGVQDEVENVVDRTANKQNKDGLPRETLPWQPHLRQIAEMAAGRGSGDASRLINSLGYHLHMVGDYSGAKDAYQRALTIDEAAFGPDHPNVAVHINNLGSVLQELGDLHAARDAYQRALTIDEAAFGPDHPKIAIRINNLGMVLQDLGDLPAARDAIQRALTIDEAAFGPDHPEVAVDINNLGTVYRALGDLPAARDAYQRALTIDETAYGPDHPKIAIRINNLGSVFKALGDLPAARDAYQRALTIDETAYGPDHPEVATDINNLGMVFYALGDLPAARGALQRALTIFERVFGPTDQRVLNLKRRLAMVLQEIAATKSPQAPPPHTPPASPQDNPMRLDTSIPENASSPPLAIVFTDIVGSTPMNARLGDPAMAEIKAAHTGAATRLTQHFGGRIISSTGDGFLIQFPQAAPALDFAQAFHGDTGHAQAHIRVGIHWGLVIADGNDIQGTNVNLAARVTSALPGDGVIASNDSKVEVERVLGSGQTRFAFRQCPPVPLKGFDAPPTLWQLAGPILQPSADSTDAAPPGTISQTVTGHGNSVVGANGNATTTNTFNF